MTDTNTVLPSMLVDGQVALVTGAGRGIGRGCALALGNIPGEEARQALAAALNDPDEDVALAVAVAYLRAGQPQD